MRNLSQIKTPSAHSIGTPTPTPTPTAIWAGCCVPIGDEVESGESCDESEDGDEVDLVSVEGEEVSVEVDVAVEAEDVDDGFETLK